MDVGHRFGEEARKLFPEGIMVEAEFWDRDGALAETAQCFDDSAGSVLFEAAFLHRDTFLRCDVLRKVSAADWELWEVKSVKSPSALHILDLAIQTYVVAICLNELPRQQSIVKAGIIHFGVSDSTFAWTDLTKQVNDLRSEVEQLITNGITIRELEAAPQISIGKHCFRPYRCPFLGSACR